MSKPLSFREDLRNSDDVVRLRETLARFQRIFNGSGYGFWEWDLETDYVDWSGGFWESIGYGPEYADEVNNTEKLIQYIHPDDRHMMREATLEHLRTGKPLSTCYRVRASDGRYVWTQVRADSIRDEKGWARYISGVNFDISELKDVEAALRESEARQVRILQAANDGIWEWYAGSGGFHFSARCWELLGYDEQDDVVTQGENRLRVWRSHIYPEDLPKFDRALNDHVEGKGMFDIEYRIHSKQGDLRWIRARGRIDLDEQGKPFRMSGTNMDITDIKRAEERVLQAKETAEKANRAKSEFLSSMSHELRTPLNAILGYAQLFEYDGNLTEVQLDNLREIRSAGEHLLQLINDVLDLAKIESGKMTVSLEPVLVSRVVAECFTLIQPQADARGVRLYSTFNNLESTYVVADNVRLKQALVNLLSNGVKYNKIGGELELYMKQLDKQQLRIGVRDTGQGIAANRQSEVFQPFNRLSAENSKIEGSGVGLVITKQLIEIMQGKLDFSSREGEGTDFWIDLPLSNEWNQDLLQSGSAVNSKGKPVEMQVDRKCKLLYVEDNPSNVRLLQQIFSRYPQFELDIAEEAFLGIYKARSGKPDVIILDINLPGMDGYETLSVLKRDSVTAHIPVVGLSANAMPYDIERGRQAGFYHYLTKPVDINLLIRVLNELLA